MSSRMINIVGLDSNVVATSSALYSVWFSRWSAALICLTGIGEARSVMAVCLIRGKFQS